MSSSSASKPLFNGLVRQAGGGEVTILVDRDTDSYPTVGERVVVLADPARIRRGVLELRLSTYPATRPAYYEIVQWYKSYEQPGQEFCFTVAYWLSGKDGDADLKFVGKRPLEVPDRAAFWQLVETGQPKAELVSRGLAD